MLNDVSLIGRLTVDPELRYTPNGTAVCYFNLAVDRDHKGSDGEKGTDFIRIVVWRKLAEIVANNLSKGRLIAVRGRLQSRSYGEDKDKKFITEVNAENVYFLDYKKEGER